MPICGTTPGGRVTWLSRSRTRSRFQSLSDPSSKISFRSESPKSENERRCTTLRDAIHDNFERNRDLLFDLFRRNSRPLRNDLNVVVSHVGIGLNGQTTEGDDAAGEKQHCEAQHKQAVVKSKINDSANHSLLLVGGGLPGA